MCHFSNRFEGDETRSLKQQAEVVDSCLTQIDAFTSAKVALTYICALESNQHLCFIYTVSFSIAPQLHYVITKENVNHGDSHLTSSARPCRCSCVRADGSYFEPTLSRTTETDKKFKMQSWSELQTWCLLCQGHTTLINGADSLHSFKAAYLTSHSYPSYISAGTYGPITAWFKAVIYIQKV